MPSARHIQVFGRTLRRERAAAYLDMSPNKFDELVKRGILPRPKRLDTLKVWDVADLDSAVDNLPVVAGQATVDNSWEE